MMPNRCLENPVFFLPNLADSFAIPWLFPGPAALTSGSPSAGGPAAQAPVGRRPLAPLEQGERRPTGSRAAGGAPSTITKAKTRP